MKMATSLQKYFECGVRGKALVRDRQELDFETMSFLWWRPRQSIRS